MHIGMWGSDFPFSLLINRPIFQYHTFLDVSDISGVMTLNISDHWRSHAWAYPGQAQASQQWHEKIGGPGNE